MPKLSRDDISLSTVSAKRVDADIHLSNMRSSLDTVPKQQRTLIQEAFHELTETIDVLSSAEEKLRIQNEQLIQTQRQLSIERTRYRDLFECAPDGYIVTDERGTILEANRAASIMLNTPSRSLSRKLLGSFVRLEDRNAFRNELRCLPLMGYVTQLEIRLRPRASEQFDASLTANAIRSSDGRVLGLRWIIRDISERKRYQAHIMSLQDALSKTQEEFA